MIGFEQRACGEQADGNAGFHVEHAGPVQAPIALCERHLRVLPDRPHGVEMTEEQHRRAVVSGLSRSAAEFRPQMIAAIATREACDAAANCLHLRRQLAPAPIDGGLVRRRRLQAHERFGDRDQPAALVAAEFLEVV
ncbi:MAG TPA: hypothetical protein VG222_03275 [Vicinamibacterales bacterium]|nr:hypothetical protein [Vicinamibacterales bacterium]